MENLSPKEFIKEFKSNYGGMALYEVSVLLDKVFRNGKISIDEEEDEAIYVFISKYDEMAYYGAMDYVNEMVLDDEKTCSDVIDFLDEMAFNGNMAFYDEQDEIIIKCGLEEMTKAFFKDYEIIWHDPNVDSQENKQYLLELKKLCKVRTFTEWKEADDYIKGAKTVCHVITSGKNGELLVKEIFSSKNVPKIITFCRAKDYHSIWAKDYEKTLCTETKIEDVISQIQKNLVELQKNTSSLKSDLPAFAPIFDDQDKSQMNHLHHYLKVIPNFNNRAQAKKDFLDLSKKLYSGQRRAEEFIKEFEDIYTDYKMEAILNWYTRPSFLFRVINNCLRIATSDSIQWSRFLLKDIERAIKDQYQAKSKNFSGLLYRGAYLSEEEWSSLKANVNREIEMHGFLSVSKEDKIAWKFMSGNPAQKVFITILVPKGPNEEEQGFAEVEEFSHIPEENEILFNVRSRFTVLETEDKYSIDKPYRHLVLLYGAQGLRKYITEENPVRQVSSEDVESILCSRCQVPRDQMIEKMVFISLVNVENPTSFCQKCLDDSHAPFLCIPSTGKASTVNVKGCLLINSNQPQIPFYGYGCSQCGVKKQKAYFGCADCNESRRRWCQSCFGKKPDCIKAGHSVILETYPFSFWFDKMSEKELNHLHFQNNLIKEKSHNPQQAEMYRQTQEFEKALKQVHLFIEQNEAQVKGSLLANSYHFIGLINKEQGKYDEARKYLFKSYEIYKSVHRENHPDIVGPLTDIHSVFCLQRETVLFKSLLVQKKVFEESNPDFAADPQYYESKGKHDQGLRVSFNSLEIYKSVYGENNPFVATSYKNIGLTYQNLGEYDKALVYYFKSLEVCKSVYGENHPELVSLYNLLGERYIEKGEYDQALEYFFKALEIYKSVYGESHPFVATSYKEIGSAYHDHGEYDKALENHFKSLEVCKSVYGENHPSIAISYEKIGLVFRDQGEHNQALECYLKSLDINRSISGEEHYSVANSYVSIGSFYRRKGEYDKAFEYLFKSREIFESVHRENHPEFAACCCSIAIIYNYQREYNKALEYHRKALNIFISSFGKTRFIVAMSYHEIAIVLHNQGENREAALAFLLESVDIHKSACDKNPFLLALSYSSLGTVYIDKGDLQKALEYSLKSLEILKSVDRKNKSEVVASYNKIGQVSHHLKESEKALEYYFKALEIGKIVYGEKHPEIARSFDGIGMVYERQGEREKAREYYQKSLDINRSLFGEEHEWPAIISGKLAALDKKPVSMRYID